MGYVVGHRGRAGDKEGDGDGWRYSKLRPLVAKLLYMLTCRCQRFGLCLYKSIGPINKRPIESIDCVENKR